MFHQSTKIALNYINYLVSDQKREFNFFGTVHLLFFPCGVVLMECVGFISGFPKGIADLNT